MFYVIGSGPSGVSCAYALLAQGCAVTMLDAGLTLDAPRAKQLLHLQQAGPQSWTGPDATFLREGRHAGLRGIPIKRVYGSTFPYQAVPGQVHGRFTDATLRSSFARGGFSNVWGSVVFPYRASDIRDWPIGIERLAPHYAAVFEFMPLAARPDRLTPSFPLYARRYEPLSISRQAQALIADMETHAAGLHRIGIDFGMARLAVTAREQSRSCQLCGLCLYGCPYELIYSSSATVSELQNFPKFRYAPGVFVNRVEETADGVKIAARTLSGGQDQVFTGERVYVACGVLQTTLLMLRSLNLYHTPVKVLDSQYFLLPMLRFCGVPGVRSEALHTLAQLVLEIDDPQLSPYAIHLQLYTYNDMFELPLRSALGPLAGALIKECLVSRLILVQGFIHSDHSARIRIELTRGVNGAEAAQVTGELTPETKRVLRGIIRKLYRAGSMLKAAPLHPALRIGKPGRGDHTGGSLPMRASPGPLETDVFGRPHGLHRIHAVDASIFPSVPATGITLSAMANAHRIGAELDLYT